MGRAPALRASAIAALALSGSLAVGGAASGCTCSRGAPSGGAALSASGSAAVAGSAPRPVVLPPLAGPELQALEVAGATVEVMAPVGATAPRPLVVVLAGAGEDAFGRCAAWREVVGPESFVLCVRARPEDGAVANPASELERSLRRSLEALKSRFTHHVAASAVTLVGGPGAAPDAVQIARQEPAFFARLVLIDGGAELWGSGAAAVFARGGGRAVLFACRTTACAAAAARHAHPTEVAGLRFHAVASSGPEATRDLWRRLRESWEVLLTRGPSAPSLAGSAAGASPVSPPAQPSSGSGAASR